MDDPRMRDTIEANSELDHVLNNLSTFGETLEAVRKPAIMREMTRIMDVEMSIIESSPEGFNALRRMYEKELERELELLLNASETQGRHLGRLDKVLTAQKYSKDHTRIRYSGHSTNEKTVFVKTIHPPTGIKNTVTTGDAILQSQVPIRTYGVLGFLLLGIVRMYSKKVQIVCDGLLVELNECVVKKTTNTTEAIYAPSPSITRPSTFQLDAFDLQISEERTCSHVRPSEDLMLKGARKDGEFHSPNDVLDHGTFSADFTPFSDVFSLQMGVPNAEESVGVDEGPSSMATESIDEDQDMDSVETIRMISPDRQTSATIDDTPNDQNTSSVGAYDDDEDITPESRTIGRDSVNTDATPMLEGTSGALTPAFSAVQTPAATESASFSRKRKSLVDDIPEVATSAMMEIIANPTDLVRGRSRVPHARVHGWKSQKVSKLSHSGLNALIPSSSGLGSIFSSKDIGKVQVLGATKALQTSNISPIYPSTPIAFSSSSMFHDDPRPTISSDSVEDIGLINEDVSSSAADSCEMDKWSVRTQSAARCLRRNFVSQKKHHEDDDVANLFEILKGKKKKESARMFHEILVLKSGGYVGVKQEEPYDDIVETGTCKLKNFCDF